MAISNYRGAFSFKRNDGFKNKIYKYIVNKKIANRYKEDPKYFILYAAPEIIFPSYFQNRTKFYGGSNENVYFYFYNLINNESSDQDQVKRYITKHDLNLLFWVEYKSFFFESRFVRDFDDIDVKIFNYLSNLTILSDYCNKQSKHFKIGEASKTEHRNFSYKLNRIFLEKFYKANIVDQDFYDFIDYKEDRLKLKFHFDRNISIIEDQWFFYVYDPLLSPWNGMSVDKSKVVENLSNKFILKKYFKNVIMKNMKGYAHDQVINIIKENFESFSSLNLSECFESPTDTINIHKNYKLILYGYRYNTNAPFIVLFLFFPISLDEHMDKLYFFNGLFFVIKNQVKKIYMIQDVSSVEKVEDAGVTDDIVLYRQFIIKKSCIKIKDEGRL